jgi:hypothetical protein
MEATHSSEMPDYNKLTRLHIPEDGILLVLIGGIASISDTVVAFFDQIIINLPLSVGIGCGEGSRAVGEQTFQSNRDAGTEVSRWSQDGSEDHHHCDEQAYPCPPAQHGEYPALRASLFVIIYMRLCNSSS